MEIKSYTYNLQVQKRDLSSFVEIKNPFTIDFNVMKNNFRGSNTFTAKVYGLNRATRESIRKDQAYHLGTFPKLVFSAGFNGNNAKIFNGRVTSCTIVKEGVNIVVFITGTDDGLARQAVSRRSYAAGTPKQTIVKDLISDLFYKGITPGFILETPGVIKRGMSIFSDTLTSLQQLTGFRFYIDNMTAKVYDDKNPPPSSVTQIDGRRLLATPSLQGGNIQFEELFDPGLVMGQKVNLKSESNRVFNGEVTVHQINHKGTISDSVKSDVTTTVGARFFMTDDIGKRIKG